MREGNPQPHDPAEPDHFFLYNARIQIRNAYGLSLIPVVNPLRIVYVPDFPDYVLVQIRQYKHDVHIS